MSLIVFEDWPDYDEIAGINYTYAKLLLEKNGYKVVTYLDKNYDPKIIDYGLYAREYIDDFPHLQISIGAWVDNGTKIGNLHVSYRPLNSEHHNPNNLDNTKQYVKERAIEVTQICNLTVDWDYAVFSVDYSH